PNWLCYGVMSSAVTIVSPATAEKLLLSAYALALPLSARWALGALGPEAATLAWLSLPLVGNQLLHFGFYNFCLSLAAYLLVVGWWLRHREAWSPGRAAALALLGL